MTRAHVTRKPDEPERLTIGFGMLTDTLMVTLQGR